MSHRTRSLHRLPRPRCRGVSVWANRSVRCCMTPPPPTLVLTALTVLGDCSEVISTHRHQRATIGWVHIVHNLNHKPKLADNREHKNCHFCHILLTLAHTVTDTVDVASFTEFRKYVLHAMSPPPRLTTPPTPSCRHRPYAAVACPGR